MNKYTIRYTEEEKQTMCEIYLKTRSVTQVKKVIPADKITIRAILIRKGIYNPYPSTYNRLTEKKRNFILSEYPETNAKQIAKKLECTPKAVIDFLKVRGLYQSKKQINISDQLLKLPTEQMTIYEVSNQLNISYDLVRYYGKKAGVKFKRDTASMFGARKKYVFKSAKYLTDEEKRLILKTYLENFNFSLTAREVKRNKWTVRSFLKREGVLKKSV